MNKSEAYKIVFDNLTECNLFKGIHDARSGENKFMYGIWTVMSAIAYGVSDDFGDEFEETFSQNMINSEKEANSKNVDENKLGE